jgi:hypothetical protein
MKLFYCFILFITAMLFSNNGYSQAATQAQYKDSDVAFRSFLTKKFSEEVRKHNTQLCGVSVIFAKFIVGADGNIKTITFSENKDSPQVLRIILTDVIKATNGLWVTAKIDEKPTDSKPFILPLIYDMEAGCKMTNDQVANTIYPVLVNILNYEDKSNNTNAIECTLLKPLTMYSQQ